LGALLGVDFFCWVLLVAYIIYEFGVFPSVKMSGYIMNLWNRN